MADVIRTSNERLRELLRRTQQYIYSGPPRNSDHDSESVLSAEIRAALEAHAPETSDVLDAAKWRALRNCARITAIGSAGMGPERAADDYAHITLNFWTGVPDGDPGPAYAREWLDTFVDKALRGSLKASESHGPVLTRVCPGCNTVHSGPLCPTENLRITSGETMKSVEFCYWLQGLFELGAPTTLNAEQTDLIKRHLGMVFHYEIDPSYGSQATQAVLDKIHQGPKIGTGQIGGTGPDGVMYRC